MFIYLYFIFSFFLVLAETNCNERFLKKHLEIEKLKSSYQAFNLFEIGPKENFGDEFFLATVKNDSFYKICPKIQDKRLSLEFENLKNSGYLYTCENEFELMFLSDLHFNESAFFNIYT